MPAWDRYLLSAELSPGYLLSPAVAGHDGGD
jgi:hypothetical protein